MVSSDLHFCLRVSSDIGLVFAAVNNCSVLLYSFSPSFSISFDILISLRNTAKKKEKEKKPFHFVVSLSQVLEVAGRKGDFQTGSRTLSPSRIYTKPIRNRANPKCSFHNILYLRYAIKILGTQTIHIDERNSLIARTSRFKISDSFISCTQHIPFNHHNNI